MSDNIYYDANFINNGSKPVKLSFNDIRTTAILDDPSMYEMSVIRYNLEMGNSIPVWIPHMKTQDDIATFDPDITSYSFKLTYLFEGEQYRSPEVYVRYIPCDNTIAHPTYYQYKNGVQGLEYYYVKSFNTIVDMFNDALYYAMEMLKIECANFNVTMPSPNAPFFEWNSETSKFILSCDSSLVNSEISTFGIYCNRLLYNLMSGFEATYYGDDFYRFKIRKDKYGLGKFIISEEYSVIQLTQEYSSGSLFTPVSSVMFTSSLIPVIPSHSSTPIAYDGDSSLVRGGLNNNTTQIITDFQSQDNSGYGFQTNLSYVPSSEYRMISLNNGSGKIDSIQISCNWKDKYGNVHPVYLAGGLSCDIKILFRRKK